MGVEPTLDEIGVLEQPAVEAEGGLDALGPELPESAPHPLDRVLAIHVLEHLPNLPAALEEIKRVMKPDGHFSAVIPCEGGMAYEMARTISARRLFEKRYGCSYDWFVKSEHVNTVWELLEELPRHFRVIQRSYWPLRIPSVQMNVVMGLTCVRRKELVG